MFLTTRKNNNSMFVETKKCIIDVLRILHSDNKDFSGINFMPPAGYNLIKTFSELKNMDVRNFTFSNNVKSFLSNLNFYSSKSKIGVDYVVPISSITSRGDEEVIGSAFMKVLSRKIVSREYLLNGIQKVIGECLNNIIDHSGSLDYNKDGLRCNYSSGQYFKQKEFVQIAIVDGGIGILSSLRKKYPEIESGKEAIKKALEARVSGGKSLDRENREYTQYSNRGIGLTTTLEIIKKFKGDLFIGSRDWIFTYCGITGDSNFINIKNTVWFGTFVILNIYGTDVKLDLSEIESRILGIDDFDKNKIDFG